MSLYSSGSSYEDGIIEVDLFYDPMGYQYFASSFMPNGYDCVRDRFLGITGQKPIRLPLNGENARAAPNWEATTAVPCIKSFFCSQEKKPGWFSCWGKAGEQRGER